MLKPIISLYLVIAGLLTGIYFLPANYQLKGGDKMGYDNKVESIKLLIRESAWAIKEGHKILFKDNDDINDRTNEVIASTFVNKAISLMNTAKAVYISDYENLAHTEIENIFAKFSLLESEFLENLKINHSHQWTDIQFQEFKDAYEELLGEL
jgi:hypothetical protein